MDRRPLPAEMLPAHRPGAAVGVTPRRRLWLPYAPSSPRPDLSWAVSGLCASLQWHGGTPRAHPKGIPHRQAKGYYFFEGNNVYRRRRCVHQSACQTRLLEVIPLQGLKKRVVCLPGSMDPEHPSSAKCGLRSPSAFCETVTIVQTAQIENSSAEMIRYYLSLYPRGVQTV